MLQLLLRSIYLDLSISKEHLVAMFTEISINTGLFFCHVYIELISSIHIMSAF